MSKRVFIFYEKVFKYENSNFSREIGGVQRYLYEISCIYKELGFDVFVIQFGEINITQIKYGISIIQFSDRSRNRYKKSYKNVLENYMLDINNDFVLWGADTISIPTNVRKTISIQHGIAFDMYSEDSKLKKILKKLNFISLYKFYQRHQSLKNIHNSRHIVCVDYNYLNWYRTYSIKHNNENNNISVIPNFTHVNRDYLYEKEKISQGGINICFARRFVIKRGVSIMTEIANNILTKYKNVNFYFAGDGPEIGSILDLQKKYPSSVYITKFSQEDTNNFHSEMDISIVPTLGSEGTSLSLLEAMANKCAVIATNIGGLTNILIDNFNGLMVNPTVNELENALEILILNPDIRKKLSENGFNTVYQGFNYNLWKEKWKKLIIEVDNEND